MTDSIRAISPQSWRNLGRELTPREEVRQRAKKYLPNAQEPILPLSAPRTKPTTPQNEGSTNTNSAHSESNDFPDHVSRFDLNDKQFSLLPPDKQAELSKNGGTIPGWLAKRLLG